MFLFNGRVLFALGLLAIAALSQHSLACLAAVVEGRVLDSRGRPVADAEVRVWRKTANAAGREENQLVETCGLRTGADGRFQTADLPNLGNSVRIVAEARQLAAARSAWVRSRDRNTIDVGDLSARRLRTVTGRVVDRKGKAVSGAMVFHSGDAPRRVEAISDDAGAFRLAGVPEGQICLFAERTGFRFFGELVDAVERPVEVTLSRDTEPVAPLRTLRPEIPREEEEGMARRVFDPFLESLDQADDRSKTLGVFHLGLFDLMGSLERLDALSYENEEEKDRVREETIKAMQDQPSVDWAEIEALIEASSTAATKAACYAYAARVERPWKLPDRRTLLNHALLHARGIRDPKRRALELARIACEWFELELSRGARSLAAEALTTLDALPVSHRVSWDTTGTVAMAVARYDLPAARALLDRLHYDSIYAYELGRLAWQTALRDVELAEQLWSASGSRSSKQEDSLRWRDAELGAPFCYRLAQRRPAVARRVADRMEHESSRIAARGAIAQALAETDPAAAIAQLHEVFEKLPPTGSVDAQWNISHSEAAACCRLLPLAERLDPQFGRECFWRVVALRSAPAADLLDNEAERSHLYLIGMLARYDRQAADRLLTPIAARLDEFVAAESHATVAAIIRATAAIEPQRAAEQFARLPPATSPSAVQPTKMARLALVRVLGTTEHSHWQMLGYSDPAVYDSW